MWTGSQGRKRAGAAGQRLGEGAGYRSWRRNTLLRLSLTMSSSSVSCSLAIRGMSSRTRCCMARHVRLSSCGGRRRDGHGPGGKERGHGRGLGSSLCATLDDRGVCFQTGLQAPQDSFWGSTNTLWIPPPVSYTNTEHTGDKPHTRPCSWFNLAVCRPPAASYLCSGEKPTVSAVGGTHRKFFGSLGSFRPRKHEKTEPDLSSYYLQTPSLNFSLIISLIFKKDFIYSR